MRVDCDFDDTLVMVEVLEPPDPCAPLVFFVVEVVEFLHSSSFLGAPQDMRLLLGALSGWLRLIPGCLRGRPGLLH